MKHTAAGRKGRDHHLNHVTKCHLVHMGANAHHLSTAGVVTWSYNVVAGIYLKSQKEKRHHTIAKQPKRYMIKSNLTPRR